MLPEVLTPGVQWGFAGLAFVLVGVIVWLISRFLDSQHATIGVVESNTSALREVSEAVSDVREISRDVRDMMLVTVGRSEAGLTRAKGKQE